MQKRGRLVSAVRGSNEQLSRNSPVPHMKRNRLLGTQAPVIIEALIQIRRAEGPEGCVPASALAFRFVRARRDLPTFHHFADETGLLQALAMSAGKLAGADRDGASVLKRLQSR